MAQELSPSRTWGGVRPGAGRKPTGKFGRDPGGQPLSGVSHLARPRVVPGVPLLVTVHTVPGGPSLGNEAVSSPIGKLLERREAREPGVRVIHLSLQRDQLHLIVEAANRGSLARGLQGLLSGIARVVNRASGREGKLWRDRYHARPLPSPAEVRRVIRRLAEMR